MLHVCLPFLECLKLYNFDLHISLSASERIQLEKQKTKDAYRDAEQLKEKDVRRAAVKRRSVL